MLGRGFLLILMLAITACSSPPRPLVGRGGERLALIPEDSVATLQVGIQPAGRDLQALPASWDTATLHLSHPTLLTQPRRLTLSKGGQFVSNGSGGFLASSALGSLRAGTGYVLTVSLWNGGVGGMLAGERQLSLTLVGGANAVTMPIQVYPPLTVSGFTPSSGASGSAVTLQGVGFSVLSHQNSVTLAGPGTDPTEYPSPISSASSVSLGVTTPDVGPGSYTWQVQVGGVLAGKSGFIVPGIVGSVLNWVTLSQQQFEPAIARGSGEHLVVWADHRDHPAFASIYGKRVDASGSSLGGDFVISASSNVSKPALAYNSTANEYLVAWQRPNEVHAQRVSAAGARVGADIAMTSGGTSRQNVQVAYNPDLNEYLVVWQEGSSTIQAQRIGASGALVGSGFAVAGGADTKTRPAVSYGSSSDSYLVVWEETPAGNRRIRGRLVAGNGTLGIGPFTISSNAAAHQVEPAVASTPAGEFMTVWVSQESPYKVIGRRLTDAGALNGGSFEVSVDTGNKSRPRLAYQPWRGRFLATWIDTRNGNPDLYGRHFGLDGSAWGQSFAIAATAGSEGPGDVAVDPGTQQGLAVFEHDGGSGNILGQRIR